MKAISVLGSTGSIGTQTLEIASEFPENFKVVALTAGRNLNLLLEQIKKFKPEVVAVANENDLPELKERLNGIKKSINIPNLVAGPEGLEVAASWSEADLVVTGIVGCAGLLPTLAAIKGDSKHAKGNKASINCSGKGNCSW